MQSSFVEINNPFDKRDGKRQTNQVRTRKPKRSPWLYFFLFLLVCAVYYQASIIANESEKETRYQHLKSKLFAEDLAEEEMAEFCKLLTEVKRLHVAGCVDCKHYIRAKLGGRHAVHLKNYEKKTKKELEKGIKKYQKQIDTHIDKIKNPEVYCVGWKDFHPNRKETLLKTRWPKDIQRNTEQQQILDCILKNRVDE